MNENDKTLRELEIMRRRQLETSRSLDLALQRAQQIATKIRESAKRKKPARTK